MPQVRKYPLPIYCYYYYYFIIIKRKCNIFLALGYRMFMCFRTWNTYPWCLWINILNANSFVTNCNNELVLTRRSIRFLSWNFVSQSVGRTLFPSTAGKSWPVIRKYFLATSWSKIKQSWTLDWSYELAGLFTQLNTCRFLSGAFLFNWS